MLTENQQKMVYWITERNNIRLNKEHGLYKPWTQDKVMQETYFCNVNREDDTVTKWIRQNWTYDVSPEHYTFAMIVARIFNLPETLAALGQPKDSNWLDNAAEVLCDRKVAGKKIWNGAYIISTNGKKMPKHEYCIELLHKVATNGDPIKGCKTLAEAHKALMGVEGLASFLAAQVVADIKNSPGHPLEGAPDWWTFSSFGPGSLRGLSWFWEREIRPNTYQQAIFDAYRLLEYELHPHVVDILCMQNLQNCFCEYDKFMRVLNGTGRSKRKYPGGK